MEHLSGLIRGLTEYQTIRDSINQSNTPTEVTGLSPIHRAHLIAALAEELHRQPVVICADDSSCTRMTRDLESFTGRTVDILPYRDFVFHDVESSSREYEHRRIAVLNTLRRGRRPVVISVPALLACCMPPEVLERAAFTIDFNGTYELEDLTLRLVRAGYRRCTQVEGAGQFSVRGGILDVFAPGEENPVRIEFFGDEVDTMAYFDIGSQRRGRSLESLTCLPNREVLPDLAPGGAEVLKKSIGKILSSRGKKHENLNETLRRDLERLENDGIFPSIDRYLPMIYPDGETACDYIPKDAMVFFEDFRSIREAARVYHVRLREDTMALIERGQLYGKTGSFARELSQIMPVLERHPMVYLESFLTSVAECPPKTLTDITAKQLAAYGGNVEIAASDIRS